MKKSKKYLFLVCAVIIAAIFILGASVKTRESVVLTVNRTFEIVVTSILSGLGPGSQDYDYNVGTGYKLARSSAHRILVEPIGGMYSDNPKPVIRPKVVQIAWDERYVLAKQVGLKYQTN